VGIEIFKPNIEPKTGGRQLVTFFLISYNQERFICEALEGAFAQTYQPLEIVLSDDCSTDRTFEIMRQMVKEYKGPHKLVLNQNEHNLGLCGNVNRILDLVSGEIVVIAGGDDISLPDRVEKSWQIFRENPDANCVSFNHRIIDSDGMAITMPVTLPGYIEKYSLYDFIAQNGSHFHGASRGFRKSVFEYFGPLSNKAASEDSTIFLRCLLLGTAYYSNDVGIYYRVHGDNYYSSEKKHLIKYKRIYWQHTKDISLVVRRGVIPPDVEQSLKTILRQRLKQNLLRSGYYLSASKIQYFFSKLLFSDVYGPKEKALFFQNLLKIFLREVLSARDR
jgi:glycosyltransferase involved in cell wall biosynthesis